MYNMGDVDLRGNDDFLLEFVDKKVLRCLEQGEVG